MSTKLSASSLDIMRVANGVIVRPSPHFVGRDTHTTAAFSETLVFEDLTRFETFIRDWWAATDSDRTPGGASS